MKISCEDRNDLENIIEEFKENIFCLNIIKNEMLDTRRDNRNTDRYEILLSLIDRFTDYIKNNSDELEQLKLRVYKKNNRKSWIIRK